MLRKFSTITTAEKLRKQFIYADLFEERNNHAILHTVWWHDTHKQMTNFNWDVIDAIPLHWYMGALSMLGSTWIIVDILCNQTTLLQWPYCQIMLALSLFDLCSSFWFFMAALAKAENPGFGAKKSNLRTL